VRLQDYRPNTSAGRQAGRQTGCQRDYRQLSSRVECRDNSLSIDDQNEAVEEDDEDEDAKRAMGEVEEREGWLVTAKVRTPMADPFGTSAQCL
jgi:hypothetical protein